MNDMVSIAVLMDDEKWLVGWLEDKGVYVNTDEGIVDGCIDLMLLARDFRVRIAKEQEEREK